MDNKYNFCQLKNVSMCIYKITNTITGKSYIGKTRNKARLRWYSHIAGRGNSAKTYIARSLKKYGHKSFRFEVIDIAENEESLNHKESFYISHYNTLTPNGYNLTTGGKDGKHAEVTKAKRRGIPVFWCRRKVIRNDGKIYDTVFEASRDNNTCPPNIVAVLKGRRDLANGFQFRYLEECSAPWELKDSYNKKNIPIGCSNGETYVSQTVAANILGLQQGNIWKVLSGNRKTTGGLTFWYLDGDSTEQTDNKENLDGR